MRKFNEIHNNIYQKNDNKNRAYEFKKIYNILKVSALGTCTVYVYIYICYNNIYARMNNSFAKEPLYVTLHTYTTRSYRKGGREKEVFSKT